MILFGIARLVAAGALLAAMGNVSASYYTYVHLYVCVIALYGAFHTYKMNVVAAWVWTFGILAVLFYPLLPLPLPQFERALIDVGGAVVMALSLLSRDLRR